MNWMFPMSGSGLRCICSWGRGAYRISHLEKADVTLLGSSRCVSALSLFPFPPTRSPTPAHIFVRVESVTLHCSPDYFGVSGEFLSFSNHGGHRGSQLESAAPECSTLCSPEQRVRLLKERNAAYCWSGKKLPEGSLRKQMELLLCHCFAKYAQTPKARDVWIRVCAVF